MHPEALNKKGKKIFTKLKNFDAFYLAGGTALALQIGHRISVDFDFFSGKPIKKELLAEIKRIFAKTAVAVSVNNTDELTVFIEGVKITFLHYPFPLTEKIMEYDGVKLLSVKEIAATKAYTIGRRGSFKDYVDLYFIISGQRAALNEILKIADKKYGGDFNARLFLEQLIYLDDVEEGGIIFLKNQVGKIALVNFFSEEIKKLKL
ncbi:MAG: nucleotidyl transferase AbiEii/AbiGii toxin family protein [Patescibacteria group bacterium]|nr:nucleotidyl transferase AbiEii/AbiGii toxin family protein [Patescibacteria group bacterium]